jgi:hypothetical protein
MTSFAFILGCVPLWIATGAGSVARQIMGTTVIGGMLANAILIVEFAKDEYEKGGCGARSLERRINDVSTPVAALFVAVITSCLPVTREQSRDALRLFWASLPIFNS